MTESKSNQLDIAVDRDNGSATVTVHGEIDLETSGALTSALAGVLDVGNVRLDLTGVDYMDSTGLRAVLVAREGLRAAGGDLRVVSASSIVTRLIEITGIHDLLDRPST
jgi:anti-sigma B factor antagonist